MKKSEIKSYLSGEKSISLVSFRGTSWKASRKFKAVSAAYNEEFGLVKVVFEDSRGALHTEKVKSSNVTFFEEPGNSVFLDVLPEVTFYYLKTDSYGQYGGGVGSVVLRTAAEKEEFEKKVQHKISPSWSEMRLRDDYHLCD